MYMNYNNNPLARRVGDCSVRAVAKALGIDWETAYSMIAKNGFQMGDMMSSDAVWGSVLRQNGFVKELVPNTCPDCYTTTDFCKDHPKGTFVVGTGNHAVAIIDGNYYDNWDSGSEVVIYVWEKTI